MPGHLPFKSALFCLAAGSVLCPGAAFSRDAALAPRLMRLPPTLQVREETVPRVVGRRAEFEKAYDLFIRYTDGSIFNPNTGRYDKVRLRAYQQKTDTGWDGANATASRFQAPTVVMKPGQTVRFKLYNQLPEQTEQQCASTDINSPGQRGCFNITNLHSHGLWVSPSGNSDNVLLSINPNVNFEYEYNIPADHPAGTFWYHPHQHGSTAMQVGGGMAGVLIVEGERYPSAASNGDLDTLLRKFLPATGSSGEVMMLQQIPYGCETKDPKDPGKTVIGWDCAAGELGVVEDFSQVAAPTVWHASGRYTTVNGQTQPVIELAERRVYRWRLVDAGFQAPVLFHIKQATNPAKLEAYLKQPDQGAEVDKLCDGEDVTQFEVASDGLTHDAIISKSINYLRPGYRSDILFALPRAGAYCVFDDSGGKGTRLLAVVRAKADPQASAPAGAKQSQADFMKMALVRAAREMPAGQIPAAVKKQIADALETGMRLGKYVPHKSFSAERIAKLRAAPKEYATFNIAELEGKTRFMVEGDPALNQPPNVKFAYQPGRVDHTLVLGTEQMWELNSKLGAHPFHIHVNPFQIISITNTSAAPGAPETDPEYEGLVGTWKDTLIVKQGYKIEIATRYQRYIGEYVLHCHILEHEDQGMMQNVKVVLPDGKGGAAAGAHGHH